MEGTTQFALRPTASEFERNCHENPPTWTASFKDACVRQATAPSEEVKTSSREYAHGNNDSKAFYQKHRAGIAEAERLKASCQAAAAASVSRYPEEPISMEHILDSVRVAATVGSYASMLGEGTNERRIGDPISVPTHLGHLFVPRPTISLPGKLETSADSAFCHYAAPVDCKPAESVQLKGVDPQDEKARPVSSSCSLPPLASPAGIGRLSARGVTVETVSVRKPDDGLVNDPALDRPPSQFSKASLDSFGEDVRAEQPVPDQASNVDKEIRNPEPNRQSPSFTVAVGPTRESSEDCSDSDSDDSDAWPPKPPLLRFKMRMKFSSRFRPSNQKEVFQKANEDLGQVLSEKRQVTLEDVMAAWINHQFAMSIETEFQFETSFPIILLTMLDAIYPRRVTWRAVSFNYQYKKSIKSNYALVERIWGEVNMEKAKDFRFENTPLRLENMYAASLREKLEFAKLMRRWYMQREHNADPYEPLSRRRAIVSQCLSWGHSIQFPPWFKYDPEEPPKKVERVIKDTWRVTSKLPINVLADKSGTSDVVGVKKYGDTLCGHQHGDWVKLIGEPGWIVRVIFDSREKLVQKQEKFRVVQKIAPAAVRVAMNHQAKSLSSKKFGDIVHGYVHDEWVELSNEKGYMDMYDPGSRARVLESCTEEDYNKMPEFKRLIWFLGSPDYLSM